MPATESPTDDALAAVQQMVQACIQCGTCTGSCPNAAAMDATPRQLWRMVLMNRVERVFASRTFALCSSCYTCTLRCPRGLALTDAMAHLKRLAARRSPDGREAFYHCFMATVRRHGRIHETELMTRFFIARRNPLLPLRFTGLAARLAAKGKIGPGHDAAAPKGGLAPLFDRADEVTPP